MPDRPEPHQPKGTTQLKAEDATLLHSALDNASAVGHYLVAKGCPPADVDSAKWLQQLLSQVKEEEIADIPRVEVLTLAGNVTRSLHQAAKFLKDAGQQDPSSDVTDAAEKIGAAVNTLMHNKSQIFTEFVPPARGIGR